MPVHDGSRTDQDERLSPPGPERSQRNPEQLVQGSQLTARSLRVQSQQLPTKSQVFEDEVLPGTERTDQPAEEMSERHDHGMNLIGKVRIEFCPKSFILRVYNVLARHSGRYRLSRRKQLVEEYFDSGPWDDVWSPRYNIAPTQPVPASVDFRRAP